MNDEVLRAVHDWLANAREDMETALLAEAAAAIAERMLPKLVK